MSEAQRSANSPISKPLYVISELFPVVLVALLAFFECSASISGCVAVLAVIAEIAFTKDYFGMGLVGLRWYFSPTESPKFPYVVYFSRPLPYVVLPSDSNAFWAGLIISMLSWFALALICGYFCGFWWFVNQSIPSVLKFLNFTAFLRCYNTSRDEADALAKSILLDRNVSFQVSNDPVDQSDSNKNEVGGKIEEEEEEEEPIM
jgi:hypothetical protein